MIGSSGVGPLVPSQTVTLRQDVLERHFPLKRIQSQGRILPEMIGYQVISIE